MKPTHLSNLRARTIAQRLSLREPQVASLELLTRIVDAAQPHKAQDLERALEQVRGVLAAAEQEAPLATQQMARHGLQMVGKAENFADFQRQFVNLCFALATGVGKTRLMGAFIAWLYLEHGIRHFFVVAPNLTIYKKLIKDFGDPSDPKYVFKGLAELATDRPLVVTGDDYQDGHAIRDEASARPWLPGLREQVQGRLHINVFNISKLSKDAKQATRGEEAGKPARIRRLQECLGQSYFDYLAKLDDLVLIMDEAHNYRAEAAMAVLDELQPLLGLELTATPFRVQGQRREWFKNIAYHYQLRDAMIDAFVKTPEVAYRKNLDAAELNKSDDGKRQLERMKLDDAVALHDETKAALEAHAIERGVARVKPFVLVVAADIEHAKRLQAIIEGDDFHGGYFQGKTVRIDSKQGAEEKARNTELLLEVEKASNPIEVVLHVESLEEGWDVTNLYTILPLRAADSPGLVLQSIGRGLRLPYGKVTGNPRVDRVTVVAHDRYAQIIDEAKKPDSDLTGLVQMRDLDAERPVKVTPVVSLPVAVKHAEQAAVAALTPAGASAEQRQAVARQVQSVARYMPAAIEAVAGVRTYSDIHKPEVMAKVVKVVERAIEAERRTEGASHQELLPSVALPSVAETLAVMAKPFVAGAIDIPQVSVVPSADFSLVYQPFRLDLSTVAWTPRQTDLVRQDLTKTEASLHYVADQTLIFDEAEPRNYILRRLVDYNDIAHNDAMDVIADLADQFVAHLLGVNGGDVEAVHQVLVQNEERAARLVYEQLIAHRQERATSWQVSVYPKFDTLKAAVFDLPAGDVPRDFRQAPQNKQEIRKYVYGGFRKAAAEYCKFDSDGERRLACVLEDDDTSVVRWLRPKAGQLRVRWRDRGLDRDYQPDFVVETKTHKWLVEVKSRDELSDPAVLAKAEAARHWCQHATQHAAVTPDAKAWGYRILADEAIRPGFDFAGLLASA